MLVLCTQLSPRSSAANGQAWISSTRDCSACIFATLEKHTTRIAAPERPIHRAQGVRTVQPASSQRHNQSASSRNSKHDSLELLQNRCAWFLINSLRTICTGVSRREDGYNEGAAGEKQWTKRQQDARGGSAAERSWRRLSPAEGWRSAVLDPQCCFFPPLELELELDCCCCCAASTYWYLALLCMMSLLLTK